MRKREMSQSILAVALSIALVFPTSVYAKGTKGADSVSAPSFSTEAAQTQVTGGSDTKSAAMLQYDIDYNSMMTSPRQVSWFRFTGQKSNGYYTLTLNNYTLVGNLNTDICDEKGKAYISTTCAKNDAEQMEVSLAPGKIYYIRMTNVTDTEQTGNYSMHLSFRGDKDADTNAKATVLKEDIVYTSSIDGRKDIDVYTFTAPSDSDYNFTLLGQEGALNGEIRRKTGELLGAANEIYGLEAGDTCYITVKSDERSSYIPYMVQVKNDTAIQKITLNYTGTRSLVKGKTLKLRVKSITPYNASKGVSYRSSNAAAVSVDQAGKITALKYGQSKITVVSAGNAKVTSTCTIKVVPAAPTMVSVTKNGAKKLKLSWKKYSGVTSVEIFRSTTKKGTYKKIATVSASKTNYVDKKLKSKKNYYYKVRVYKTVGNTKFYSAFSGVKGQKTT